MSVLECNRAGCDNVMCDRYSHKYGYICNDCFNEIVRANPLSISNFMKTTTEQPDSTGSYDYFDTEFSTQ